MSSIRVSGNTSGHYDLTVPDVAGSNTIALDKIVVSDSSGNVGIGTTQPDLKLHVDGTNGYPASSGNTPVGHIAIRAKNESSSHGANMGVANASPWGTWIQAQDANNLATNYPLLLNPNGGNVGIGTTNPSATLQIMPPNEHQNSFRIYRGKDSGYQLNYLNMSLYQGNTVFNTTSTDSSGKRYLFQINGTEKFRIDQNGNVGIGLTDPGNALTIARDPGDSRVTLLSLKVTDNDYVNGTGYNHAASIVFDMPSSEAGTRSYRTAAMITGGKDGIADWFTGSASTNFQGVLRFHTRQDDVLTEQMRIDADGNVGIGTASPATRLDVQEAAAGATIKLTESSDSGSNPAAFIGYRSRGTSLSSPTAIQASNYMTQFAMGAHDGSSYSVGAKTMAIATETWNSSSHGTSMGMYTTSNGTTTPQLRLNINSSGHVTMDYQPSANVFANSGNAGAYNNASSNSDIVATGIRHNIGGHYNASNGRFTCPTGGRYFVSFSANWYNNSAGSWIRPSIRRNGTIITQHYEGTANNPTWMHIGASAILDCSTGDYLTIHNGTNSGAGGGMDVGAYSNITFHKIA